MQTIPRANTASDIEMLTRLNADYIDAVQTSNIARFRALLADDFLCTLSDGTFIDRDAFLEHTAAPYSLGRLEAHDVRIRIMGDVALVHARTTFTQPDGTPGSGRYTDVWARRAGRWVAVAAHVTRAHASRA
jgi:ketosteroid isomerase-like protein